MNHLLALFFLLLIPITGSANGVERGDKLKAPPVANISRKVQKIILDEVERHCDIYDRDGRLMMAELKLKPMENVHGPHVASMYEADVALLSEDAGFIANVHLTLSVYPVLGEAVQIWSLSSGRCAPMLPPSALLGYVDDL